MNRPTDSPSSSIPNLREHTFLGHEGIRLVGDVGGQPGRPAVILLHGGGQTRHSWSRAQHDLVARGYHVINFDSRGHGDSQWSEDGGYSLDRLVADLRCVMATLSVKPALVGASMGGMTALALVGEFREDLVTALVLVDIVPKVEPAGIFKIRRFMTANPEGFANVIEAADAVAAYNPHRPRPSDTSGLMRNLRRREDGRLHWHWDPRFMGDRPPSPEPPNFHARALRACAGVRVPSLLVRGMNSDIVGEDGVREFREHLPQLEIFDVVGAGHMVAGDRNDAFNAGVAHFLARSALA
ncbi:MAG: alpha/beta fold hydrolase [Panacagrimonas sp.]